MSKKKVFSIILFSVIFTLIVQLLAGSWLSARLATWPVLRRFNIYQPQAPIVITNNQVIRTSDSQDSVDVTNRAKSRLASVGVVQGGRLVITGSAMNLTADGYFMSAQAAFAIKGASYIVTLNDGRAIPIGALFLDPATNLVIFKADVGSLSVVNFDDSKALSPGQKIFFLANSQVSFNARFQQSFVSSVQSDTSQIFSSDKFTRSFGAQSMGTLIAGQAIVDTNSDVAGMWDGAGIISSNILKTASDNFFTNSNRIVRPSFGFSYRMIGMAESNALNLPQGALVVKGDGGVAVAPSGPAASSGLHEGDVIISANSVNVNETNLLSEVLEHVKPGEPLNLTVVRNQKQVNLLILAGQGK